MAGYLSPDQTWADLTRRWWMFRVFRFVYIYIYIHLSLYITRTSSYQSIIIIHNLSSICRWPFPWFPRLSRWRSWPCWSASSAVRPQPRGPRGKEWRVRSHPWIGPCHLAVVGLSPDPGTPIDLLVKMGEPVVTLRLACHIRGLYRIWPHLTTEPYSTILVYNLPQLESHPSLCFSLRHLPASTWDVGCFSRPQRHFGRCIQNLMPVRW